MLFFDHFELSFGGVVLAAEISRFVDDFIAFTGEGIEFAEAFVVLVFEVGLFLAFLIDGLGAFFVSLDDLFFVLVEPLFDFFFFRIELSKVPVFEADVLNVFGQMPSFTSQLELPILK